MYNGDRMEPDLAQIEIPHYVRTEGEIWDITIAGENIISRRQAKRGPRLLG